MPYKIEKRGGEFCVVKSTDDSTVKCHPTEQEAKDHMAALYANVPDAKGKGMAVSPYHTATRRWSGIIAIEDEQTGDGRVMAAGSARWENLPGAFRWDVADEGGHYGAVAIGTVEGITRQGSLIHGWGYVDAEDPLGQEAIRKMDAGFLRFVSVDPDDLTVEVMDTSITAAEMEAAQQAIQVLMAGAGEVDPGAAAGAVVYKYAAGQMIERWLSFRIRGVTLVDIPAFDRATITLDPVTVQASAREAATMRRVMRQFNRVEPSPTHPCECGGGCGGEACSTLIAASGRLVLPIAAPAWVFATRTFDRLTNLGTFEEPWGRYFAGHIAPWGACHLGSPANLCITAPRDPSGYAMFNRRPARTSDGVEVMVGPVTMSGLHVDGDLLWDTAAEVMEDADAIVGWAVAGADQFGPWIAGALLPSVEGERLERWLGCEPSGDWRNVSGALHLIGTHMVPDPGLPVALVASGRTMRLVGAGAREMALLRAARESAASDETIEAAVLRVLDRRDGAPFRDRLATFAREREQARLTALAVDPERKRLAALAGAAPFHVRP